MSATLEDFVYDVCLFSTLYAGIGRLDFGFHAFRCW